MNGCSSAAAVRLSTIGEVHDHGVIEHRAVAFDGFQPFETSVVQSETGE